MATRCTLVLATLTAFVALAALAAESARADGPIDLDVLYLGNAGTPRAQSYERFLREHFASVRAVDRDTFDPDTVGDADVVLLDWSQQDVDIMAMEKLESPLGPRTKWTTPTVLLGSAGLLITSPWQTNGSYG